MILRAAIVTMGAVILLLCIFVLPAMWRAVPFDFPDYTYALYIVLISLYAAAVPFYFTLYQAMKLLRYIDRQQAFTLRAVRTLRSIAYSAFSISALFIASLPFFFVWADKDDAPGLLVINIFLVLAPFAIAVFAAVLQRLLHEAIKIKSENDLTV